MATAIPSAHIFHQYDQQTKMTTPYFHLDQSRQSHRFSKTRAQLRTDRIHHGRVHLPKSERRYCRFQAPQNRDDTAHPSARHIGHQASTHPAHFGPVHIDLQASCHWVLFLRVDSLLLATYGPPSRSNQQDILYSQMPTKKVYIPQNTDPACKHAHPEGQAKPDP